MIRSANAFKLVSPSQPDLQQLWGRFTSQPNALSRVGVRVRVSVSVGAWMSQHREQSRVRVRVRAGGGMRYLRTEKLRSFHLRPFIVLTITKRAHYKAERETTCSMVRIS